MRSFVFLRNLGILRGFNTLCATVILLAWPMTARAQSAAGAGAQQSQDALTPPPAPSKAHELPPNATAQQPLSPSEAIDKIMAQEQAEVGLLRQYAPLVETYIQYLRPDRQLGAAPASD